MTSVMSMGRLGILNGYWCFSDGKGGCWYHDRTLLHETEKSHAMSSSLNRPDTSISVS